MGDAVSQGVLLQGPKRYLWWEVATLPNPRLSFSSASAQKSKIVLSWQVGFSVGAESDDELEVSERMLVFMLAFYERYPSLLKVPLFLSRKVWRKNVVTWLPCQGTSREG